MIHPEIGRFAVFFMAASLGFTYMSTTMISRGLIDPMPALEMFLTFVSFSLVLVNTAALMVYMTDLIRDALKEKKSTKS